MSKRKKIIIAVLITIPIITISIIIGLAVGTVTNTGSIFVQNVSVNNEEIQVKGDSESSVVGYAGYSYNIDGSSLFIKLRYSLYNPFHKGGAFDINIKEISKDIKKVYIQGQEASDVKLIWSK